MIKNLFLAFLSSILLLSNFLDGFNTSFNKFHYFYFIDDKFNWGNLYIEGLEIDFKAAVIAQRKLKGGHFDEAIHSIIPHDFSKTEREWKSLKDHIAKLIGPLPNPFLQESAVWRNSSIHVEDLLKNANATAPIFKHIFKELASHTETRISFGPGDQFMIKSNESLVRKINQDSLSLNISKKEALGRIGDVLRGTIIVDKLDKIPVIISEMIEQIHQVGGKVAFKNLWIEDRDSGYVGIHAKLLLPFYNEAQEVSYLLAEIQIHLDSIVDGTELSAKERAHLIYENVRSDQSSHSKKLSAASKLLFLTAMEEALGKLDPQTPELAFH